MLGASPRDSYGEVCPGHGGQGCCSRGQKFPELREQRIPGTAGEQGLRAWECLWMAWNFLLQRQVLRQDTHTLWALVPQETQEAQLGRPEALQSSLQGTKVYLEEGPLAQDLGVGAILEGPGALHSLIQQGLSAHLPCVTHIHLPHTHTRTHRDMPM